MAKKKVRTREVVLQVPHSKRVVLVGVEDHITTVPKATEIRKPLFAKWLEICQKIPSDHWLKSVKLRETQDGVYTRRVQSVPESFPISQMHTMQLVNSIRWCVKMADQALRVNLYINFGVSRAQYLAKSPQWGSLLSEAKTRDLKMIHMYFDVNAPYAEWYGEAMTAIVGHKFSI